MTNETPGEVVARILEMTERYPTRSYLFISQLYDEHGVDIDHLLTDNGREYGGRALSHPFELYLAITQITHRRPKIGSPETNGFCERFHRTAAAVSGRQGEVGGYLDRRARAEEVRACQRTAPLPQAAIRPPAMRDFRRHSPGDGCPPCRPAPLRRQSHHGDPHR